MIRCQEVRVCPARSHQAGGPDLPPPAPAAPHLMVHVPAGLLRGHLKNAELATRWAGLLMDLYGSLGAESCRYHASIRDVPAADWDRSLSGQAAKAALSIVRRGDRKPVPRGFRSIPLASGATLFTSLPVRSAPRG